MEFNKFQLRFFFFFIACNAKFKNPSLPLLIFDTRNKYTLIHSFLKELASIWMQTALSRVWTQVSDSMADDGNHNTTGILYTNTHRYIILWYYKYMKKNFPAKFSLQRMFTGKTVSCVWRSHYTCILIHMKCVFAPYTCENLPLKIPFSETWEEKIIFKHTHTHIYICICMRVCICVCI